MEKRLEGLKGEKKRADGRPEVSRGQIPLLTQASFSHLISSAHVHIPSLPPFPHFPLLASKPLGQRENPFVRCFNLPREEPHVRRLKIKL